MMLVAIGMVRLSLPTFEKYSMVAISMDIQSRLCHAISVNIAKMIKVVNVKTREPDIVCCCFFRRSLMMPHRLSAKVMIRILAT